MSTTTIRLPDELKMRVASAAENADTTPHQFILQAIAEKTAQAEQWQAFNHLADSRYADILATGETVSWADMRAYLEGRVAGNADTPRPIPKKLLP